MAQYEVTFIVDPVLSGDESKGTAKTYQDMLAEKGGSIVNVDNVGLRSLAYPINKRTTGVYYCIEFQSPGVVVDDLELALRRDERIMRYLTVKLDKYGVKYNDDKRNGRLKRREAKVVEEIQELVAEADTLAATGPAPAVANAPEAVVEQAPTPSAVPAPGADVVEAVEAIGTEDVPLPPAPAEVATDDLTKIEGIGPKINEVLNAGGIFSYQQLADASVESVKELLIAKGGTYKTKDPSTWGEQSQLAADGKWDELSSLQDRLMGGKEA